MGKNHIIIPTNLKPSPARYEITAAQLLAEHFKIDVEFLPRSNQKTPDFLIDGVKWELKSPTGVGKRNIERQLQTGLKQSQNIIFDARRSKIHINKIRSVLQYQFRLSKSIKRIVLIDKNKNIQNLQDSSIYAIIPLLKARQRWITQVLNLLFYCDAAFV